jgi:hypothetical protein
LQQPESRGSAGAYGLLLLLVALPFPQLAHFVGEGAPAHDGQADPKQNHHGAVLVLAAAALAVAEEVVPARTSKYRVYGLDGATLRLCALPAFVALAYANGAFDDRADK